MNRCENTGMDLNINHYGLDELFDLFNIPKYELTHNALKTAKKKVLMSHPDKSNLDSKYFLFFSAAYKRLYSIFVFQSGDDADKDKDSSIKIKMNMVRTNSTNENESDDTKKILLNNFFKENPQLTKPKLFNKWLNDQYEKHNLSEKQKGYDEWLETVEDRNVHGIQANNINNAFADLKRQQSSSNAIVNVNHIEEISQSKIQGLYIDSSDQQSDYSNSVVTLTTRTKGMGTGTGTGVNYNDLKQAYELSTNDVDDSTDIRQMSYEKYLTERNNTQITPCSKMDAENIMAMRTKEHNIKNLQRAMNIEKHDATMTEKMGNFWSDLKLLK